MCVNFGKNRSPFVITTMEYTFLLHVLKMNEWRQKIWSVNGNFSARKTFMGPVLLKWFPFNTARISNHMTSKMCDEIT